jgi:hypothetical protein
MVSSILLSEPQGRGALDVRARFCSCHGKCDCDPEGGACKNVVKLHQLRDSAPHRTIINNIDELAVFLEANFKNEVPSRSPMSRRKAAVPSTSGTFTTSKLTRSK